MMKSASLSRSTVFFWVPCKRPDNEAPKKGAEPVAVGVEYTNCRPLNGADSSVDNEYDPVRFARPGIRYAAPALAT